MYSNKDGWNPYIVGVFIGILALASVLVTTKTLGKTYFLGTSTTFVRAIGLIEKVFFPEHVAKNEYFKKEKVKVDWQFMLVIGIFFGALISSLMDKSFKIEQVPPIWKERFGQSPLLRAFFAFLGGVITMFGARLADGCPTGHGLSGMMQLSLSGFIAVGMFFITGALITRLIYGGKRR